MKTDTPAISVLMTLYNREPYVAEAIQSVLSSTHVDFELIVVDDGSTDQSVEIVRELAGQDQRVQLTCNPKNLGDYGNRMKAASLAQGALLKYVDSDDLLYPHSLSVMVETMTRHPEVAFALSHSVPEEEKPYPLVLSPEDAYRKHFLGRGCFACGPTGAIIRRSAFRSVGGFNPSWKVLSDIDLWLRLGSQHPVALMPPGLVWWRRHEGQEFSKGDAAATYLELGHRLFMTALDADECPLGDHEQEQAVNRHKQHHARRLIALAARKRSPALALRLFKRSKLSIGELLRGIRRYS